MSATILRAVALFGCGFATSSLLYSKDREGTIMLAVCAVVNLLLGLFADVLLPADKRV